jgi:hypothetical protein|tara:strand:- start:932 stop:1624 length:693 start_codon:yes stop_codon:yes gene_type:complete
MTAMSLKELQRLKMRVGIIDCIKADVPKFAIKRKSESLLMRLLSFILFFNKDFMTNYVSTIYPTIYVPDWWGFQKNREREEIEILAHEYVHLYDRKHMWWLFNILYLSPQIFSLLAFGAFWNLSYLWFLLCLLPWPSPGRAWLEFRGYRMSLAIFYWNILKEDPENKEKYYTFLEYYDITWIVKQFTGPAYYFMFPFKSYVERKFRKSLMNIRDNKLSPELLKIKNAVLK